MNHFKFSNQLLFTFAMTAILVLIVAIIGWLSFRQVVSTQGAIIDEAIPAMDTVQSLARNNARMVGAMSQLENLSEREELSHLETALSKQIEEMHVLLDSLAEQGFEPQDSATILEIVNEIHSSLQQQISKTSLRLDLKQHALDSYSEILQAAKGLVRLSESLVANASAATTSNVSSLYEIVDNAKSKEIYLALDRLIEVDIDRLERMSEFQLVSFQVHALLEQLESGFRSESIDDIKARLKARLVVLARRISDINDPHWRKSGHSYYETLATAINDNGLFDSYRDRLILNEEMNQANEHTKLLAGQLNDHASALLSAAGTAIDNASNEARKAVQRGVVGFATVAALMIAALAMTVWAQFRHHFISRLHNMESAVRQLAAGNYDVQIATEGDDEMSRLGVALQQFKEDSRERQRLQEKLEQQQQMLENLVEQRTGELQQSNQLLEKEVTEHTHARQLAETANKAKTDFLAAMSHELRTPLSGVLGTLQLLSDTGMNDRQREYIRMIRSANTTLLEILEDMLGYSQIDAGKLNMEACLFPLRETIDNILSLHMVRANAKGIALIRELSNDIPDTLSGDRRKLNQILLNLVGNAVKFTDEGSVTVSVTLQGTPIDANIALIISVKDTGIGIFPAEQEKVFQPFFQVQDSENRHHGGTGLGLAICQRLVKVMGGEISLTSERNEGTTITFKLNFEAHKALPNNLSISNEESIPNIVEPLSVLVVEDDSINRSVCTHYLEFLGHRALQASDGIQALAVLQQSTTPIDVILMDISLPGSSGVDVALEIRNLSGGHWEMTPIIAMSAHVFGDAVESYYSAGMCDFLSKPFSRNQLCVALNKATSKKSPTPASTVENQSEPLLEALNHELLDIAFIDEELDALGVNTIEELLALFESEHKDTVAGFQAKHSASDHKTIAKESHRLRSAAGNLGMSRLVDVSKKVEIAASLDNVDLQEMALLITSSAEIFHNSCSALEQILFRHRNT